MKFPIAWHKESLTNMTEHYQRERKRAEEALARCVKGEAECQHYAVQIAEAERRGVPAFDRDRLLKPNVPHQPRRDSGVGLDAVVGGSGTEGTR
jgi:hypothetical protein